jgi:hypothetical protein
MKKPGEAPPSTQLEAKIVLLGDTGVGKVVVEIQPSLTIRLALHCVLRKTCFSHEQIQLLVQVF